MEFKKKTFLIMSLLLYQSVSFPEQTGLVALLVRTKIGRILVEHIANSLTRSGFF
jgi:hypothetical protein